MNNLPGTSKLLELVPNLSDDMYGVKVCHHTCFIAKYGIKAEDYS